jgi:prevent-host-death family protein
MTKHAKQWSVAEAKAHLSAVIEGALHDGPQVITKRGEAAVIVISAAEWRQPKSRTTTLSEFFSGSPLRGLGADFSRLKEQARDLDL